VLEARADDSVEVSRAALSCDVWEMEAALERGDAEGALALYDGELLAGFHAGGSPEWESWIEAERRRVARSAAAAATRLASAAEAAGDAAAELRWRRAAAEIEPHDEVAVRALLLALDAAGDRAGALAAFEAFERAVRRAYDADPATETVSLIRAIRARRPAALVHPSPREAPPERADADGDASPSTGDTGGETSPASSPSPENAARAVANPASSSGRKGRSGRAWRWAAGMGVAAVLAATAVLIARRGVVGVDGRATRVAILPFAVRSAPAHAWLAEGMTDLLSVRLDGTGELTTVDPYALVGFLRSMRDPWGPRAGMAAARRFGAGRFVLGSVVEAGGRLHLQAALYDASGRQRARAEVEDLSEDSLFSAVDLLVRELVAGQMRGPPQALDRTAALTTTSLPALKDYLAGESAFRGGRFAEASERFGRAVAADTGFALALYRLSVAQEWGGADGSAAAARALRLAHRLSPADRMLLQARVAFRTGSAVRAEALCRTLLASHPDHVEARNELGEILFHRAMWEGRSLTTSRPEWRAVIALDSASVSARVHLASVAALEGRRGELDTLVRDVARISPAHESLPRLRLLRAVAYGDRAEEAAMIRELRVLDEAPHAAGEDEPWSAAWRTADFLEDPAAGLRVTEMMTAPYRAPESRLMGFTTRAHLEMAMGRWRDARGELQRAAEIDPAYAARTWAFLVATSPFPLPRVEVERARDALARTAPPSSGGTGSLADHERAAFPVARHHYLLGALAVSLGDGAEVERQIAALGRPADPDAAAAVFTAHLRHQLRARQLHAAGHDAQALAEVERGWPEPVASLFMKDDSYSTVAERYFRAELLAAVGRDAEALAWYGSLAEDISRGLVFPTAAHLGRARVLERMGRPADAAAEYDRYLRLWGSADAEAQPGPAFARERLAQLRRR
jgi:tetratricopeptide (TPR) repeat protein